MTGTKRSDAMTRIYRLRWHEPDKLDGYAMGYLDGVMENLGRVPAGRIEAACDAVENHLRKLDERAAQREAQRARALREGYR